jgi:hypothetical protein
VARRYYAATAEILSERDGIDAGAARGDVEGYLTDAAEIVASRSGSEDPPPKSQRGLALISSSPPIASTNRRKELRYMSVRRSSFDTVAWFSPSTSASSC